MSVTAINQRRAGMAAALTAQPWLLPALACISVAVGRMASGDGSDVPALLMWAERMLDGARPSVDFTEVNPPGSYFLYLPAALLGRWLGISSELATELLIPLLAGGSLWLCWRTLAPSGLMASHNRPALLAASIVILMTMPAMSYGQREHIGVLLLLPLLATVAATAAGHRPVLLLALANGFLGGLSLMAKPHFALILAASLAYQVIKTRSLWTMFGPVWMAAASAAMAYLLLIGIICPEFYTESLPLIADVYLPVRLLFTTFKMVGGPLIPLGAVLTYLIWRNVPRAQIQSVHVVLVISGLIGVGVFYLQSKGYPYHGLPAMQMLILAAAWEVTRRMEQPEWLAAARPLVIMTALAPVIVYQWNAYDPGRDYRAIAAAITEVHEHPKMLAISQEIAVGFPVVRMVGGTWVHPVTHLWTVDGVAWLLANKPLSATHKARLMKYYEAEVTAVARSLAKADIVLAQVPDEGRKSLDWLSWANAQPAIAEQLARYSHVRRIGDVLVMARKDDAQH